MPPTSRAAAQAIGRIEQAHRQFKVGALRTLYPQLQGPHLAAAVAREQLRDGQYVANMRTRLVGGTRAVRHLSAAERTAKVQSLVARERRYLAQHIEAAGWRMASEADIAALKSAGEPGAVWVMDPAKRNHTPDCVRMDGRMWSWAVLDRVNPGNRHTGCGCKLYSRSDATAAGIRVLKGIRHQAVKQEMEQSATLTEARKKLGVSLQAHGWTTDHPIFGIGKGWDESQHPRDDRGRFVRVYGQLPKAFGKQLKKYQDAVAAGDLKLSNERHAELMKQARKMPFPKITEKERESMRVGSPPARALEIKLQKRIDRRDALQTLQRMRRATANPYDQRVATGATATVHDKATGRRVPVSVGMSVHSEGIEDTWTEYGTYGWLIPATPAGDALAADMAKSKEHQVTSTGKEHFIETKPGLDPVRARQVAREMERRKESWRNRRASDEETLLRDDRPLDVGADERKITSGTPLAALPNITDEEIGLAGEMAARDIRDALQDLGVIPADDDRLVMPAAHDASPQAPIDVFADGRAIEVKAHAMRDATLGELWNSPGIGAWQAKRKRAAASRGVNLVKGKNRNNPAQGAKEKPLSPAAQRLFDEVQGTVEHRDRSKAAGFIPAVAQPIVDTDNGVVHVFYHEFPDEDKAFSSAPRLPVTATKALAEGGYEDKDGNWVPLTPGAMFVSTGGEHRGDLDHATMFLGTFPLRYNPAGDDVGGNVDPQELVRRLEAPAQSLDQGAQGRGRRAGPRPRNRKKEGHAHADKTRKSVEEQALELEDRIRALDARGLTQAEIAKELGFPPGKAGQSKVSRLMTELKIGRGRGARTDLSQRRQGDVNVA